MPTYVIGHKNPDTDAVCSALAYADLLRLTSQADAVAACCGEIPLRTAFALEKAGVKPPVLLLDVRPKAGQVSSREYLSASTEDSIMESFERMRAKGLSTIPVLDKERRVEGMLSLMKLVGLLLPNSENKTAARTIHSSLSRVQRGLGGEFQSTFAVDQDSPFTLVVGALSDEKFASRLNNYQADQTIVVTGDRESIQRSAIEHGVRAVVISGNYRLSPELLALAESKKVTVILSSYDTATTTLLVKCSKRISDAIDRDYLSFSENTPLETVLEKLENVSQTVFPVLCDDQRLTGVIAKSDLIDPPRTKLILVDHNEFTQAVNGVEQAEIIEVIDHHRLGGGLSSKTPIRFINEPLGSTCTIVSLLFQRSGLTPSRSTAILLISGIISDTLYLSSPTTTETDKKVLHWLQEISGLDLPKYVEEFFAAGSLLQTATPDQAVRADCKEFTENGWTFAAAQVEEQTLDDFWKHREELLQALEALRKEKSLDFACLLVTDITRHYSVLQTVGSPDLELNIGYPKLQDHLFELNGIVSRKKQLLPHLTKVMGQVKKG